MRNGWDGKAFDRWLNTEPTSECESEEHQFNCRCLVTNVIHCQGRVYPRIMGFGDCETEVYPYSAEEKQFDLG